MEKDGSRMTFIRRVLPGRLITHVSPKFKHRHLETDDRMLDDDYAAYVLARELGKPENVTSFLLERAMRAPFLLFNDATGFMEARNADGSWAGEDNGWTEGE